MDEDPEPELAPEFEDWAPEDGEMVVPKPLVGDDDGGEVVTEDLIIEFSIRRFTKEIVDTHEDEPLLELLEDGADEVDDTLEEELDTGAAMAKVPDCPKDWLIFLRVS